MASVEFTQENERFIDQMLAGGIYRSQCKILNDVLTLLRTRIDLVSRIDEGNEDLRNGRYLDVDQDGLNMFFEELKASGHELAQPGKQP